MAQKSIRALTDDENEFNDLVNISFSKENDEFENSENFEEAESILENFIEQIEDYIGSVFTEKEEVQDTEEYINLKLSSRRTIIGKFDLIATILMLNLSFLAVIVGLFGVNIKNHLENSSIAFLGLSSILVITFIIMTTLAFMVLKRKKVF